MFRPLGHVQYMCMEILQYSKGFNLNNLKCGGSCHNKTQISIKTMSKLKNCPIWPTCQPHDIIREMASEHGEVSGAQSSFCL